MAIGSKNNDSGKSIFYVKTVKKDENENEIDPYFSFRQKQADGSYQEVQKDNSFSGKLTKVTTGEFDYKGTITPQVTLKVEDGNEVYVADLQLNIATRGLFNNLLSLDSTDGIRIQVYRTKPTEKSAGKRYLAYSLWQNDDMIKWKYLHSELPATEKVMVGKKELLDSSKVDDFFINALNAKFNGDNSASAPPAEPSSDDVPL